MTRRVSLEIRLAGKLSGVVIKASRYGMCGIKTTRDAGGKHSLHKM